MSRFFVLLIIAISEGGIFHIGDVAGGGVVSAPHGIISGSAVHIGISPASGGPYDPMFAVQMTRGVVYTFVNEAARNVSFTTGTGTGALDVYGFSGGSGGAGNIAAPGDVLVFNTSLANATSFSYQVVGVDNAGFFCFISECVPATVYAPVITSPTSGASLSSGSGLMWNPVDFGPPCSSDVGYYTVVLRAGIGGAPLSSVPNGTGEMFINAPVAQFVPTDELSIGVDYTWKVIASRGNFSAESVEATFSFVPECSMATLNEPGSCCAAMSVALVWPFGFGFVLSQYREMTGGFFMYTIANGLTPVVGDYTFPGNDKFVILEKVEEVLSDPCNIGVIGPLLPLRVAPIATKATFKDTVTVAPMSGAANLIEKQYEYPLLFRMFPSPYYKACAAFVQSMGWNNVAMISDLYFVDSYKELRAQFSLRNIAVRSEHEIDSYLDYANIVEGEEAYLAERARLIPIYAEQGKFIIDSVKRSGAKVIVALLGPPGITAMYDYADSLGMIGEPYIWIVPGLGEGGFANVHDSHPGWFGSVAFNSLFPAPDPIEAGMWAAMSSANPDPYNPFFDDLDDDVLSWPGVIMYRSARILHEAATAVLAKGGNWSSGTEIAAELRARTTSPTFDANQDVEYPSLIYTRKHGGPNGTLLVGQYDPATDAITVNHSLWNWGWTPGMDGLTDGRFADPTMCEANGRVAVATETQQSTFQITSLNSFGESVSPNRPFVVAIEGPGSAQVSLVEANGTTEVTFTVDAAGAYQVHVTLDGVPIKGSPYRMDVSEISEDSSNDVLIGIMVALALFFVCVIIAFALYVKFAPKTSVLDPRYEVKLSDVEIVKQLGVGAYGEVFMGEWRGSDVAVKKLKPGAISKAAYNEFVHEIGIMCQLRHPNCLLFMGASTEVNAMCIVTEFMEMGDVFTLIHDEDFRMSTQLRLKWLSDTCKGMTFLHAADPPILHRDLKSLNLLVTASFDVKVADFGLSGIVAKEEDAQGTLYWTAPEVLHDASTFTTKSDVYSFGVIVWEIATGKELFPGVNIYSVALNVQAGGRPLFPDDVSSMIKDVAEKCWAQEPHDRHSFPEALGALKAIQKSYGIGTQSSFASASFSSAGSGAVAPPQGSATVVTVRAPAVEQLWERVPVEMPSVMMLYEGVVSKLARKCTGFMTKHQDSEISVAFSANDKAFQFAAKLQIELLETEWPEVLLEDIDMREERHEDALLFKGLRVSCGVCFGELNAARSKGGKVTYRGPTIEKALAACKLAKGGQILATQSAIDSMFREDGFTVKVTEITMPDEGVLTEVIPDGLGPRVFCDAYATSVINQLNQSDVSNSTPKASSLLMDYATITFGDRIGTGSFGETFMAAVDGTTFACKRLLRKELQGELYLAFRSEVTIMCKLDHPNVISIKGFTNPPIMSILMEFAEKGALQSQLDDVSVPIGPDLQQSLLQGIAKAMRYLHNMSPVIIHRDLKPANVLIMEDWTPKVCDFGMSRVKSTMQTMTTCGTAGWTAPEVLLGQRHDEKIDVFSFAVVMHSILTRSPPYPKMQQIMLVRKITKDDFRPVVPDTINADLKSIMVACWNTDPVMRPSFKIVVNDLTSAKM